MSPVRRLLLAALPPLLLATGGCAQGASGPTQEEYAAAADGVCQDAKENIDGVFMAQKVTALRASLTPDQEDEESIYLERAERWIRVRVVPAYQALSNGLKGIPAPDGDAAYLTDLYADLDERIEVLHIRPSEGRAVIEGDEQLRQRFVSYGMEKCPPVFDPTPDYEDPDKVVEALEEQLDEESEPPPAVEE